MLQEGWEGEEGGQAGYRHAELLFMVGACILWCGARCGRGSCGNAARVVGVWVCC